MFTQRHTILVAVLLMVLTISSNLSLAGVPSAERRGMERSGALRFTAGDRSPAAMTGFRQVYTRNAPAIREELTVPVPELDGTKFAPIRRATSRIWNDWGELTPPPSLVSEFADDRLGQAQERFETEFSTVLDQFFDGQPLAGTQQQRLLRYLADWESAAGRDRHAHRYCITMKMFLNSHLFHPRRQADLQLQLPIGTPPTFPGGERKDLAEFVIAHHLVPARGSAASEYLGLIVADLTRADHAAEAKDRRRFQEVLDAKHRAAESVRQNRDRAGSLGRRHRAIRSASRRSAASVPVRFPHVGGPQSPHPVVVDPLVETWWHTSNAFKCERRLIEQAFSLNHAGKCLTTILDDAHLMDLANLRKLRLLFEDFPKNHNLILIGRPTLLAALDLGVNHDIKSRVTYSAITQRLAADDMLEFILKQLDRVGLPHNTFTSAALELIVRSADGVLRQARNLCIGCMIEAVRSANKTIDIDNVNRVLRQPHWQKETDIVDF